MWTCQSCKADNPDSATLCQSCGTRKPSSASASSAPSFFRHSSSSGSAQPTSDARRKFENCLSINPTASALSIIGTIEIIAALIMMIVAFFVVNDMTDEVLLAVLAAIAAFITAVLPGILLKALASIVQRTDDTANLIKCKMEIELNAMEKQ